MSANVYEPPLSISTPYTETESLISHNAGLTIPGDSKLFWLYDGVILSVWGRKRIDDDNIVTTPIAGDLKT